MTFSSSSPRSVAIIGAGISGLSCARALTQVGAAATLFEKSRSLGGRCATRRWEGHIVDHGAQYFTMRDEEFRRELESLCGDQLRPLDAPFLDPDGQEIPARSPRWYHAQGNNRLGKALLGPLPVRMEASVAGLETRADRWRVGEEWFDAVVSSAPLPQTLALLGSKMDVAGFVPCLTAFFSYRGEAAGNSSSGYARPVPGDSLAWSACENHKAGRILSGHTVFVAQASPEFSVAFLEAEPTIWAAELRARLEERWRLPAGERIAEFTHRWRYARWVQPPASLPPDLPAGLFLTGDAFAESRVESAWLAGRATAARVLASR